MPLNTVTAAVYIAPTAVKTFFKHYKRKASKFKDGNAEEESTDDVLYDEAFHIVRSFIQLGTYNTVESLQEFTNTHIISPPWAAVSTVLIPLRSCNKAADLLLEWFDPEELKRVVGGERWWQVRGLNGVEAEWVTERKFLKEGPAPIGERIKAQYTAGKLSDNDADILRMNNLDRVMLYIHGGAYFWGSINTHRYQIIKYARKMEGKVFAVNYRKAPQYPWPCPLQDVLAAYLYLTDPPPEALHEPVAPSKIVLAGDSAGAGLSVCLLTVLRDLGKPLPAGAVLISPWVDLTHSFPSVMENTATDIIPPYGFIHKPSAIWPVNARSPKEGRVAETDTWPPPKPGHADTLRPDSERIQASKTEDKVASGISQTEMLSDPESEGERFNVSSDTTTNIAQPTRTSVHRDRDAAQQNSGTVHSDEGAIESSGRASEKDDAQEVASESGWMPKPPKVLMEDPNATPLELRSQIQLYATNEQLTHPLVSPVFQASLGNLCPLYIIAGDGEALRDEIIHLAHRAAYPEKFPSRPDVVQASKRQKDNAQRFRDPTRVHLQVFDGMCHVLTVFTFHTAVKYAYRSIAEFAKHVTDEQSNKAEVPTFPELRGTNNSESATEETPSSSGESSSKDGMKSTVNPGPLKVLPAPVSQMISPSLSSDKSGVELFEKNKDATKEHVQEDADANKFAHGPDADELQQSSSRADESERPRFSDIVMVRQRVDVHGRVRQMEPIDEIACLQISSEKIGLLREAPAKRWLSGQELWDKRYKPAAERVERKRRKNVEKYENTLKRARELGFVHRPIARKPTHETLKGEGQEDEIIQSDRRWGPFDLDDEDPPPSAIVGRKDTMESLALLRKTLYHSAPRTVKKAPKRKAKDVIVAAFDPTDDPTAPPKQSISEQQHTADVVPIHGLNIWTGLMTYFGKKSSSKAVKGTKRASSGIKKIRLRVGKKASLSRHKDSS